MSCPIRPRRRDGLTSTLLVCAILAAACSDTTAPPEAPETTEVTEATPLPLPSGATFAVTITPSGTSTTGVPLRKLPDVIDSRGLTATMSAINENNWVVGTAEQDFTQVIFAILWRGGLMERFLDVPVKTRAFGLSETGVVVGSYGDASDGGEQGFRWQDGAGLVLLPAPPDYGDGSAEARDVDEDGNILVVYDRVNTCRGVGFVVTTAVIRPPYTSLSDYDVIPDPTVVGTCPANVTGSGVDNGVVFGQDGGFFGFRDVFRWTSGTTPQLLGTWEIRGSPAGNYATGSARVAVGSGGTTTQAVRWDGSSLVHLGSLAPDGSGRSVGLGVNRLGWVVGRSATGTGEAHAFLWTPTSGMIDLGTLGGDRSVARDVNDQGYIVGEASTSFSFNVPVIWFVDPSGGTNQPPENVGAGGPYTGTEGTSVALQLSGSDPDGDALTFSWDLGDGTTGSGATPPASHTYADNGTYNISLTADDGVATRTATTIVKISNVAPSISAITGPVDPQPLGTAISVATSFSDAGSGDTHEATVDWGDASTPIVLSAIISPVQATHTYSAAGVYPVSVTVTDDDGGADTKVFEFAVIFDPSAGSVAGNGQIASPPDAYVPDPTLSGPARFGFSSRYKKGATTPDGRTRFRFRAGDLSFVADSYQWLVIAGARAKFKGTGQINRSGDYGFMLTAIDGEQPGGGGVDRFRIKIWDRSNNDAVVYDNQMGAEDGADPTTGLVRGEIRIRK